MAETDHIAEMAEKLSNELFGEMFWRKVGPTNQNWECEEKEKHALQTHPSDVVFCYDEPYSDVRTYINCDLKSYAKGSITASAVRGAVESLSKQIACAEKSEQWRDLYIDSHVTPQVCGLLFVYNHDGEYDKDFKKILDTVKLEKLDIPKGSKLIVLGPEDIFWLDNVRYEIQRMRGTANSADKLPDAQHCKFYYPQLVRRANIQQEKAKAATLEMLTSPWITLEYENQKVKGRSGIIVFYRRRGETPDEFVYLIDYLRHYQLLKDSIDVSIKILDTSPTAPASFQKAVAKYIEEMGEGDKDSNLSELVKRIRYSKMNQVVSSFSTIELGMDYE